MYRGHLVPNTPGALIPESSAVHACRPERTKSPSRAPTIGWPSQLDVQRPLPGHMHALGICMPPVLIHAPAHVAQQFLCVSSQRTFFQAWQPALQCQSINSGRGMRRGGRGHSPPSPGCIVSLASTPSICLRDLSLSPLCGCGHVSYASVVPLDVDQQRPRSWQVVSDLQSRADHVTDPLG